MDNRLSSRNAKDVKDVIIIGAGPCGLAVAARLREHTPSALFTDEEHQRYHWIRKHNGRKINIRPLHGSKKSATPPSDTSSFDEFRHVRHDSAIGLNDHSRDQQASMLVLDATKDRWMAKWEYLFSILGIAHLRSPMFFHLDPRDRDGLLAFAHAQGREKELQEICGCVGKEVSKHKKKQKTCKAQRGQKAELAIDERDRKDYFTPPQSMFIEHCRSIVKRYDLQENEELIRNEVVEHIDYGIIPNSSSKLPLFTIRTNLATYHSKVAVLAIGPGNPRLDPTSCTTPKQGCLSHSHCISPGDFPSPNVRAKIRRREHTCVLIVGGGLTAAQLSDLAIRKGVSEVHMITRGELKVKSFDVDLEWMGKFRNHEKAVFWSADSDEERLQKIRTARNGGSITPRYQKLLKHHVARSRLSIHTYTTLDLSRSRYDPGSQSWPEVDVHTTSPTAPTQPDNRVSAKLTVDYIYLATGTPPAFASLPMLRTMQSKFPLKDSVGGLPCLNDDLMWRDDVPLFCTGAMAGLRLGPGAGNLEGARMGAERVAWGVADWLGKDKEGVEEKVCLDGGVEEEEEEEERRVRYYSGMGSRFESLEGFADG